MNFKELSRTTGGAVTGILIVSLLGACSGKDSTLPKVITDLKIDNTPIRNIKAGISPDFKISYLGGLYDKFLNEKDGVEDRLKAIADNISLILDSKGGGNDGTALRIDENGTYLTLGELLTTKRDGKNIVNTATAALNLKTGNITTAQEAFVSLPGNIALIHAPSNQRSKAVENIAFDDKELKPKDNVWLISIAYDAKSDRYDMRIMPTKVAERPSSVPNKLKDFLFLENVDLESTMGGGVVVNSEGKIVGLIKSLVIQTSVESDAVHKFVLAVPIKNYLSLLNNAAKVSLPKS